MIGKRRRTPSFPRSRLARGRASRRRSRAFPAAAGFRADSPLERRGFELPVPLAKRVGLSGGTGGAAEAKKDCPESAIYPAGGDRGFESSSLHQRVRANGDGGMRSPSSSRGNGWTISLCLSRDHTPVLALPADGRFVKILTSRAHLDVSAGVCVPIRGDAGHHLVRFWAVAAVVRGEALGANGSSGVVSPISAAGVARFFSIWASSQVLTAAAARSRPTSS